MKVFSHDRNCENLSLQLKAVHSVSKTIPAKQEGHHELCERHHGGAPRGPSHQDHHHRRQQAWEGSASNSWKQQTNQFLHHNNKQTNKHNYVQTNKQPDSKLQVSSILSATTTTAEVHQTDKQQEAASNWDAQLSTGLET